MATVHETEEEKEVFEVVRKSEESILEAGRQWAKAVGDAIPVELPVLHALVKGAFSFAEAVMKAQREFAESMFKATRPTMRPRHGATGTASVHRATPRARPTSKVA